MKKVYNKLIRDGIPEIIKSDNHEVEIIKLNKKDFQKEILKKVVEEAKDFSEAKNKKEMISELADLQEILMCVYDEFKIDCKDVSKKRREINKKRGGFKKKLFLKSM